MNEEIETMGCGKIALALSKAQGKFGRIVKDKVAKVRMKAGGEFTYTYADLSSVLDAVRPALSENEIALIQKPARTEQGAGVETVLIHSSGQELRSFCAIPATFSTPQEFGAFLSYAKRYGLCAILGVTADDDGDDVLANAPTHSKTSEVVKKMPARPAFEPRDEPPPPEEYHGPPEDMAPEPPPVAVTMYDQHGDAVDVPVVPFGKHKGTPIAKLDKGSLEFYMRLARETLVNPQKKNFHGEQRIWLGKLMGELERRMQ